MIRNFVFALRRSKHISLIPTLLLFFDVLLQLTSTHPVPSPQVIVRSQSLLYPQQPGRQVDLTHVLPTAELFWLNIEEGYFACQVNSSEKYLKIFRLSRLCDGIVDCYEGSDELGDALKCSTSCSPANCNGHGVCLSSTPDSQCHCDDGYGGKSCEMSDVNECRQSPCSVYAECTNTLGSFLCTCRVGFVGDGFECEPVRDPQGGIISAESTTLSARNNVTVGDAFSTTTAIIDGSDVSGPLSTVTLRTFTTSSVVEGTASSAILDGLDESFVRPQNQNSSTTAQPPTLIDNQESSDTSIEAVEAVTEPLPKSDSAATNIPTVTSESSSVKNNVEDDQASETNQNSISNLDSENVKELSTLSSVSSSTTARPEDIKTASDEIPANENVATTVIPNINQEDLSQAGGSEQESSTAPSSGNLSGFQIPNSVDDVLTNVKLAVDGFIRQNPTTNTEPENSSQNPAVLPSGTNTAKRFIVRTKVTINFHI